MKKVLNLLLLVFMVVSLGACFPDEPEDNPKPIVDENVELKINAGADGRAFITFNESTPYVGLDGVTYKKGDLSPTWSYIGEKLGIDIIDVTPKSGKQKDIFITEAATGFVNSDMIGGNASQFIEFGTMSEQYFVALNDHWDQLPDLKAFLDENPAYTESITANDGNIYYAPYFDGVDDITRLFFMRHDWVEALLDGDDQTYDTGTQLTTHYQPFYDQHAVGTYPGTTMSITRSPVSSNVISLQNASTKRGDELCSILKTHIDTVTGNQYDNRSEFFISGDAAYDADELVSLMRCVKANPQFLTGTDNVEVYFPRQKSKPEYVEYLAAIWGVRGINSPSSDAIYIGDDGMPKNRKGEEDMLESLGFLHQLYKEGLILPNFDTGYSSISDYRTYFFEEGTGFMTFEYNASTTGLHLLETVSDDVNIQAVLPPLADWFGDGMERYTESVRSVKSNAWGIPSHLDGDKLEKALELINYPYSDEGSKIVVFGPPEWWDGDLEITYKGETFPKMHPDAIAEVYSLAQGSNANYMRMYVGATLPIGHVKTLAMEYQTLSPQGVEGIERINAAVAAGALKYSVTSLETGDNPGRIVPPTSFPLSELEQDSLTTNATFSTNYNDSYILIIKYGYDSGPGKVDVSLAEFLAEQASLGYNDTMWLFHYNNAYNRTKD